MQRRHGNRAQRPVGHEDQGIGRGGGQVRLKRANQPVVQALRVREVFPRGPFLQGGAQGPDLLRQGICADRHGKPFQPAGQAHQQFCTVGQDDRIHHDRRLRHDIEPRHPRPSGIDTVVAKIIPQLGRPQQFHRLPRLAEVGFILFTLRERSGALQEEIHQLKVHRTDGLAKGRLRAAIADRHAVTDRLQGGHRPTVRRDRFLLSAPVL